MIKSLVVLLTLFLSACGSVPLNEAQEKQIQSIAIVSLVPEKVTVMRIGLTVFNNDLLTIPMDGEIESIIVSAARNRIAIARPDWTIKNITVDRNELMRRLDSFGLVMSSSVEKIGKELGELASRNKVDAILVLTEARYDTRPSSGVAAVFKAVRMPLGGGTVYADIAASIVNSRGDIVAGASNGRLLSQRWVDLEEHAVNTPLQENFNSGATSAIRSAAGRALAHNVNVRLKELGLSPAKSDVPAAIE